MASDRDGPISPNSVCSREVCRQIPTRMIATSMSHTVTVTEAAIILVGTGRPAMRSRHPSRSRTKDGGPGPSRCRSLATPGSIVGDHRPEVRQEARGPPGWSSTRSSVGPRRFRQVGNGGGQMTSRVISPGARLEACPNERGQRRRRIDKRARTKGGAGKAAVVAASKKAPQAVVVKDFEPLEVLSTHRPCLAAVEQNRPDQGLVNAALGFERNLSSGPQCRFQAGKGATQNFPRAF